VNFGALTTFLMMHIALIYRFVKIERKRIYAVMPAIGFLVTGAVWYGLDIHAKEMGLAWIAVGILYLAYITRGFKVKTVLPV
jgi:uncharacterized protein YqgC (DUF456 family)